MLNWCDGLLVPFCRLTSDVQSHPNFSFVLPCTCGDLETTRQIEHVWQIRFERCCSSVLLHTLLLRVYLDEITYKQQLSAKQLPPPPPTAQTSASRSVSRRYAGEMPLHLWSFRHWQNGFIIISPPILSTLVLLEQLCSGIRARPVHARPSI